MPLAPPVVHDPAHGSCVRRVPIFTGLTPDEQDAIAVFAHSIDLPPGALLDRRGSRGASLFIVHSGRVKVSQVARSGRQRLLRVASPGDVVGEHAFLTGQPSDDLVEALEAAQLCAFRSNDLARVVAEHPSIAASMLRSLSQRLLDAERRLAMVGVEVPVRLASFLLDLPTLGGGGVSVRLPWPKKDLASFLGTTPESLSRGLERLQRLGLITVSGPEVELVDPAGLERLVDGLPDPRWSVKRR